MQNGLTANQMKYTKNHGNFFWTNHFARPKVKIMKRDGLQNMLSIVRPHCAHMNTMPNE
jgi:hypothetical protein